MFTQKSNHFNVETIINIHQGTPAEILEFKFRVLCLPETTERKQKKCVIAMPKRKFNGGL